MRKLTAAVLVFATSVFLSPGLAEAAAIGSSQKFTDAPGAIKAALEKAATQNPQMFVAELVDASGKVVATRKTTDGTYTFEKVPPGNYTVRVIAEIGPTAVNAGQTLDIRLPAGEASVNVAAGATSNVTVGITAAAAAAAASAAAATQGSTNAASSLGNLFGMGQAGTVLALAGAAGVISAVALTRNNDQSPSR